jgi:uncharacterized protein
VIAESSWLILDRLGGAAQDKFLSLVPSGELGPLDPMASDWVRFNSLCRQYADLRLDFIDASLVALAERLGELKIATPQLPGFSGGSSVACRRIPFGAVAIRPVGP